MLSSETVPKTKNNKQYESIDEVSRRHHPMTPAAAATTATAAIFCIFKYTTATTTATTTTITHPPFCMFECPRKCRAPVLGRGCERSQRGLPCQTGTVGLVVGLVVGWLVGSRESTLVLLDCLASRFVALETYFQIPCDLYHPFPPRFPVSSSSLVLARKFPSVIIIVITTANLVGLGLQPALLVSLRVCPAVVEVHVGVARIAQA